MKITQSEKGIVKHWTENVQVDDNTMNQAKLLADMPFIHKHVALMPDCHLGIGATVGSVIATKKAIIPAAVGVDIGCGMMACQLSLKASDLPDSLVEIRSLIESAVPVGMGEAGSHKETKGAPMELIGKYVDILVKHPKIEHGKRWEQLGTLGGGNHFIELCIDESQNVWIMLHSGSRGAGNKIGQYFIELAKLEMEKYFISLPDKDLAYLPQDSKYFYGYIEAVSWAQEYAKLNRETMMAIIISKLSGVLKPFSVVEHAINCHHNYVSMENHFNDNVWVTRKGAIQARQGTLGIIPGSMGAKSFIVRGKGNPESFNSCSHGAGRVMSRAEARKKFTLQDHIRDTDGVECRKDDAVIDETPKAYKDIEAVMAAQADLVEIVHTLKQVMCIKG